MKRDSRPGAFVYAGLDFILDQQGKFHFLEANDHPVGLTKADKLSLKQSNSIFNCSGIDCLINSLVNSCENKYICLLLPDCFIIKNRHHSDRNVTLQQKYLYEGRIKLTLEDFNQLADGIYEKYPRISIVDNKGIRWKEGKCFLVTGEEIGALYRRSTQIPMTALNTFCVNDLRLRSICTDKMLTSTLILDRLPNGNSIKSYSYSQIVELLLNTGEYAKENIWIIRKPKNGSASRGVKRIKVTDILMPEFTSPNDYIFQPWIKPATIQKRGFEYYYDIRVFVIDSKVVSGFARQSAAPISGIAANSPLSWCTTTGPSIPIISGHSKSESCVYLTKDQVHSLFSMSRKIVNTLDKYATETPHSDFSPKRIEFNELHNISEQMDFIFLQ